MGKLALIQLLSVCILRLFSKMKRRADGQSAELVVEKLEENHKKCEAAVEKLKAVCSNLVHVFSYE